LRAPLPQQARLALASRAFSRAGVDRVARAARDVERLGAALALLNPAGVLERGYALVTDDAGEIVTDAATLQIGDELSVKLAKGGARTSVTATKPDDR
jgi:exodeoxyribonuclease VII large subunit